MGSTPLAVCGRMEMNENFAIVVVGGSAGAVEMVMALGRDLPGDLNAAVFIALHLSPSAPSALAELVGRRAGMVVALANDGEEIAPGRIYVARPDLHLVIEGGRVSLGRGPRENGHRPAVDPLFRTAARVFGPRVIGVVLSGNLDDGAMGLREIRTLGGRAIVQDPRDSAFAGMPTNAIDIAGADAIVPAAKLAEQIIEFARHTPKSKSPPQRPSADISTGARQPMSQDEREVGEPSVFGCPDCGGALWEMKDGEMTRFRCRVGHAYNEEALLEAQTEGIERAMWAALRALEEATDQAKRMTERMRSRGHDSIARRLHEKAREHEARARIIRHALQSLTAPAEALSNQGMS
jgi:two-component system, chemotaxis family, protein-glutamate methylesterase/glutaminase